MRKMKYGLSALVLVIIVAALDYSLPQVTVGRIIQTEVKRVDTQNANKDVYHIQAENIEGSEINVFRNEDNLLFLKFTSADMQATANQMAQGEDRPTVAIRHYGWRVPIFSMFPNAVSVWGVEPDYRHIPVFNITVIVALLGAAFFIRRRVRRVASRLGFSDTRASEGAADDDLFPDADPEEEDDWLSRSDRPGTGDGHSSGPAGGSGPSGGNSSSDGGGSSPGGSGSDGI